MSPAPATPDDDLDGFAVAVVHDEGRWSCHPMGARALGSLDAAVAELAQRRGTGAVFALLDVDEEFFLVLRPGPRGVALLLSDATASLDYDIAEQALDVLQVEVPDLDAGELDDTDPWPEGDLGLLVDVGLPAAVLGLVVDDTDLYPDEQLTLIAERCGFADELARAVRDFRG